MHCATKYRGHKDVVMDVSKQVGITLKKIIGLMSNGAACDWKDKWCCYLAEIKTKLMSEKNSHGITYFSCSFSTSQLCLKYSRSVRWSNEESNHPAGGCCTKFLVKEMQVKNSFLKLRRREIPYTLIFLQLYNEARNFRYYMYYH